MTTRIVELIYTESVTGTGEKEDPCRARPQLWTQDGQLVAQYDPSTRAVMFMPYVLTKQ